MSPDFCLHCAFLLMELLVSLHGLKLCSAKGAGFLEGWREAIN